MGLEQHSATTESKGSPRAAAVQRRMSEPVVSPKGVPRRSATLLHLDDDEEDEEEEYVTFIRFESLPMLFPYHADSLVDSEEDMEGTECWRTC